MAQTAETILVVEDESLTRWAAARALRRAGFSVLEASNIQEALACLAESSAPVALFVIDALLSNVLGTEVARALRDHNPLTPVLYLHGYGSDVLDITQLEAEGHHTLGLPLVDAQLGSRVRQILAETFIPG